MDWLVGRYFGPTVQAAIARQDISDRLEPLGISSVTAAARLEAARPVLLQRADEMAPASRSGYVAAAVAHAQSVADAESRRRVSPVVWAVAVVLVVILAGPLGVRIFAGYGQLSVAAAAASWLAAVVSALAGLAVAAVVVSVSFDNVATRDTREDAGGIDGAEEALRGWLVGLEGAVTGELTRLINEEQEVEEGHRGVYHGGDIVGKDDQVETESRQRFQEARRRLGDAAIGLAGPRGVGKTTLIKDLRNHAPLFVEVSAPVAYDPREFVLYLGTKVCAEVVKVVRRDEQRGVRWAGGRPRHPMREAGMVVALHLIATLVAVVATAWHWRWSAFGLVRFTEGRLHLAGPLEVVAVIIEAVAVLWLVVLALRLLAPWTPLWRWWARRHGPGDGSDPNQRAKILRARTSVLARARRLQDGIQYQEITRQDLNLKIAIGRFELAPTRSAERERRALTYPEAVDEIREVLGAYDAYQRTCDSRFDERSRPTAIVAIDELDKIESPELAQRFINEIKGIFDAPGTQFVVSVSEDALASFESRGFAVRDAFDSAFHDIFRVTCMSAGESYQLLMDRVVARDAFRYMLHCFSGGLPRDLLRAQRAMLMIGTNLQNHPIEDLCAAMVEAELRQKALGLRGALKPVAEETGPMRTARVDVLQCLRAMTSASSASDLHDIAVRLWAHRDQVEIAGQVAAYVFHCATMRDLFTKARVDADALPVEPLDLLADARLVLQDDPAGAMAQIDEFRERLGLEAVTRSVATA
ncbi:hypothetical protein ABTZ46_09775 [Nocardioides sp. NPDC126508]